MADLTAGSFAGVRHESTRVNRQSRAVRKTPWISIFFGLILTLGLFALKVIALGLDEGWDFWTDLQILSREREWQAVPWHLGQWSDIGVYTLEAIVAGAAGSVVFNYAVNNVSQTISNIWQQVDLTRSMDPTVMRVEPQTREWLSGLSEESAMRARDSLRHQADRIRELEAEVARLRDLSAGKDFDMEARNVKLSNAFATIIDQIRILRDDVGQNRTSG